MAFPHAENGRFSSGVQVNAVRSRARKSAPAEVPRCAPSRANAAQNERTGGKEAGPGKTVVAIFV